MLEEVKMDVTDLKLLEPGKLTRTEHYMFGDLPEDEVSQLPTYHMPLVTEPSPTKMVRSAAMCANTSCFTEAPEKSEQQATHSDSVPQPDSET